MREDDRLLGRGRVPDGPIPNLPRGVIVVGGLVLIGAILLLTMFYTIEADEVAIVQRFGKYVRREEPGLRTKLPFGLETVRKVKVQRVFKAEFGFRTEEPGVRTRFSQRSFAEESLMLTGDLNVAEVAWIVQFRIIDPVKYLFGNRNPALALSDVAQIVMRSVVGDHTVTEVLTERRAEIAHQVQVKMQELLNLYETGLRVETVQMQSVTPPSDEVKRAFNEVNEAQQEQSRKTNEAVQAFNQEVPRERGEADRTLATAKGDAARFTSLLTEYRKAPEVTRRRLYLETMREIIPAVKAVLPTAQDVAPEERLGRNTLTALMVKRAREHLPNLGIELIDVRIKSINYVREVEQRVYERMISERRRIAARFRSEGDGASAKIRGEKERELDRLRSEAYRKAQEIIGKADAEAARIYAEAYGQDAEFYAFYQTLDAYKQTLQKNASLLLTTGSDFYRYLKDVNGVVPHAIAKEGKPSRP